MTRRVVHSDFALIHLSKLALTRSSGNVLRMTELMADSVNRRFREELARCDIGSGSQAAQKAGVKQQWLSRRLTGQKPWTVRELEEVCLSLGISYSYVATGERVGQHGLIPVEKIAALLSDHVGPSAATRKSEGLVASDGEVDDTGDVAGRVARRIGRSMGNDGLQEPGESA